MKRFLYHKNYINYIENQKILNFFWGGFCLPNKKGAQDKMNSKPQKHVLSLAI